MRFEQEITRANKKGEAQVVWVVEWRPTGWPRPIVAEGKTIKEAGENAMKILKERAA